MSTQYATSQAEINTKMPKINLQLAVVPKPARQPSLTVWTGLGRFIAAIFNYFSRPDFDYESWRRIEFPNEYSRLEQCSRIRLERWM